MNDAVRKIKETLDIVSLIGESVSLKKSGNHYKGLCPFHSEKTPSLTINRAKQMFHCFGCGAGGDMFAFVMKHERVEFPEAVRMLAVEAGIELSNNGTARHQRLFNLMSEAELFYSDNLMKNQKVIAYLKEKRGLTEESIRSFRLGCTNGGSTVSFLRGKGFSNAEISEAGLAVKKEGEYRDFFWKRVMFPIIFQGRTRGFGGRMVAEGAPKYLNSPATPIFDKGSLLYGLNPMGIRDKGYVLIVEGYLDVIICHQNGYQNATAPLGTSLSKNHVKLLGKYTDTFIIMFDADDSGRKAVIRASELLFQERMKGGVGLLPECEDPDSFLSKGGDLDQIVRNAMPFSVFLVKNTPASRKRIFSSLLFRDPLETAEFLAYGATTEEGCISAEMSARSLLANICRELPSIIQKDSVEVKMIKDKCIVLFDDQRFVLGQSVTGDYRQQATQIMKKYIAFKNIPSSR